MRNYNLFQYQMKALLHAGLALTALLLLTTLPAHSDNRTLLRQLDLSLEQREGNRLKKEALIDSLKRQMHRHQWGGVKSSLLELYQQLYEEYYVYKFDSAIVYNEKSIQLAQELSDTYHEHLSLLQKSELLALGGRYLESMDNLRHIDTTRMERPLLFKYHITSHTLNTYLAEYGNEASYRQEYERQKVEHLHRAMTYMDDDTPNALYYKGEYYLLVERDDEQALQYYQAQVDRGSPIARFDAMTYFAMAQIYLRRGDKERHEEYLIRSCLVDIDNQVKENMALSTLATHLFQKDADNVERAERYIRASLEDANFYDSRLRIIESSRFFTDILPTYQLLLQKQSRKQQATLFSISVLAVCLIFGIFFYVKQNRQLAGKRNEMAQSNDTLLSLNGKLRTLNAQLLDTNHKRERLAKIYIDLCADYISRLKSYQSLVKRKIKANQAGDLVNTVSSAKLSEQDAASFLIQFDKAFIDLYPTFTTEFNKLLREDGQVSVPQGYVLTTELRIFALIRLGIKESSEIALLLFLSPQTVYNYRSMVKARALRRDTFEDEVRQLCTVLY